MYPNGRLQEFRLLDCVTDKGLFLLPAMIAISFGEKQFQNPASKPSIRIWGRRVYVIPKVYGYVGMGIHWFCTRLCKHE